VLSQNRTLVGPAYAAEDVVCDYPNGERALSGGFYIQAADVSGIRIAMSRPDNLGVPSVPVGGVWRVLYAVGAGFTYTVTTYAVCANTH
jgi:hypothetical protein